LHHNEQNITVFIAPDKTKLEEKHKRLIAELKERRSQGEENLMIRNGQTTVRSIPSKD